MSDFYMGGLAVLCVLGVAVSLVAIWDCVRRWNG